MISVEKRFWSKVDIKGNDECWEWKSTLSYQRYGRIRINGRMEVAHRVAYKLSTGDDPGSFIIMHSCDNNPCCNPSHLSKGSNSDNMQDMIQKGRGKASVSYGWNEVREMRQLYIENGMSGIEISCRFNINQATVYYILNNDTWHDPDYIPNVRSRKYKLTWDKVREIRRMRGEGCTVQELIRIFGIGHGQMYRIINNERWIEHGERP